MEPVHDRNRYRPGDRVIDTATGEHVATVITGDESAYRQRWPEGPESNEVPVAIKEGGLVDGFYVEFNDSMWAPVTPKIMVECPECGSHFGLADHYLCPDCVSKNLTRAP